MTGLTAAVVSIAATRRRRFQWSVWWSRPPQRHPFAPPDAHGGGAKSAERALEDAERVTGRSLVQIEPAWARAWSRVMQGQPAFSRPAPSRGRVPSPVQANQPSCWTILDVAPYASPDEIKRAFRARALKLHPDQGGEPEAFRALQSAYERALQKRRRRAR